MITQEAILTKKPQKITCKRCASYMKRSEIEGSGLIGWKITKCDVTFLTPLAPNFENPERIIAQGQISMSGANAVNPHNLVGG